MERIASKLPQKLLKSFGRLWHLGVVCCVLIWCSCGYKDLSTDNGKLAIIQQANSFLTAGQCGQALEILLPLYVSNYVDDEVRLVYSSAYACSAGFSFPSVIAKLKGSGTIWSVIVTAMYSTGSDGHLANYQSASVPLRQTTKVAGSYSAVDRPDDPNVYMIFMQLGVLASVLSKLGVANSSTGAKTVAITGLGTNAEKCAVQVALATIVDSVSVVGSTGSLSSLGTSVSSLCVGNLCSNKDPGLCDVTIQTYGGLIIDAIDTQWL